MRKFPQQPRPVPAQVELPQNFPEVPLEIIDRFGDSARDWQKRLDEFWTRTNQAIQQAQNQTAGQINSQVVFNVDSFLIYANGVPTPMFSVDATGVRLGGVLVVNTPGRKVYIGEGIWNDPNTPFYVDSLGNFSLGDSLVWDAATDSLTVVGSITATSGTIGGFDIGVDYIRDVANSMGLSSAVTGGDDVRFWAGATFVNRASAPFRVLESGTIVATAAAITGTISGRSTATIASTIDVSGIVVTDLVNARLNTQAKTMLSDFTFGAADYSGALKSGTITWNTTTGAITGGSGVLVYRGGIIGAASGVATFTLDAVTGNATFAGTVVATAGSIGGFNIGSDYIRDSVNSFGLASTVTGGDDVRFWAGASFASRATAPFRIYESGGGSLGGFVFTSSTLSANSGTGDRFFIDSSPGNITISMGDNSLGVGQINMIGGVTNSNIAVYASTGSGAGGVQLAINDTSNSGIVRITNNSGLGIVLASFLNQITFDGDTNIYRSAANTLKTDDAFIASGTVSPLGLLDLSGASAGQIQFPATQNPSANANTLDDYEEGTFTPSLGGSATYTLQSGTYTKVGRNVHFQLRLTVNAIGTGSTTTISGLPFTSAATIYGACSIAYFASLATNVIALYGYVNPGAATVGFSMMNASGASVTNTPAILGSGTDIILTGYYTV